MCYYTNDFIYLYVGGTFTSAWGYTDVGYIMRYNTVTSLWSKVSTGCNGIVHAI